MYHVSAQGVDERMINIHYYIIIIWRVFVLFFSSNFSFAGVFLPCRTHTHVSDTAKTHTASVACCLTADGRYSLVHC